MNTDILSRLADVEPPLPPDYRAWYIATAIALLIAATALLTWRFHGRLKSKTCKEENIDSANAISELTKLLTTRSSLDSRLFAYRLATVLRLGLHLQQLTRECPDCIHVAREQWPQIVATLQQLRYSSQCATKLDDDAIETIRTWLTHNARRQA